MDWTTAGLFAFLLAMYGLLLWSVWLVMRERRPVRQRLRVFVVRRPQWSCARCRTWFYGTPQDGPVCDACKWKAFLEYLQEVA